MLPFSIALRPGVPIYEQVVYAVTSAIVTEQLRAGDAFPSVRSLSQELKINPTRPTAHRIVAALINDGLLAVRPGIGRSTTSRPAT
jgi:GntR family transcriptional regulator